MGGRTRDDCVNPIRYRAGYKYQLARQWSVNTGIVGYQTATSLVDPWVSLSNAGLLIVRAGYAWDGPSGPTVDTKDFMRGSLAHDALYQLMREGALPQSCREAADKLLHDLCREDGMNPVRAAYVYAAVREFAGFAARRGDAVELTAP